MEDLARRRLQKTIAASLTIPFYKESFGDAHPGDNRRDFPTLKRSDIPLLNQSVREVHRGQTEFFSDNSSGSTGMPVEFLFDAFLRRAHARRSLRTFLASFGSQ